MMSAKEHKLLKKYGKKLGREKLALRIIELCKIVAEEQHYKNSVIAAGQIQALAVACGYECYWREKRDIGFDREIGHALKCIEAENV